MTPPMNPAELEVRDIGSRLELFVDDWLIERMDGVSLELHHPVPREVVLQLDRPWEGPGSYDPVIAKEGDLYRLWYRAGMPRPPQRTAYAESSDGVHFDRPALGICEFDGSRDNNILLQGPDAAMALCVFKDANPEAPASGRYKAVGRVAKVAGERDGLRAFRSKDGLRWTVLEKDPVLVAPEDGTRPILDSHTVAYWDTNIGQYVAYMRGWVNPRTRAIRRNVSDDFRTWTDPEFIDLGDSPPEHLYKNSCTQYFRAPHIYLMFPKRFVPDRKFHADWEDNGISEAVFMTSRDGVRWDRRFMEGFLRPGLDAGNWTDRNMYIGVGVVPTGPGEMSVYYAEHFKLPTVRIRRGTLRTDGFVSAAAGYSGGELVTRPLTFTGGEMLLNYSTSAVGSIRVELQGVDGRPLDGFRMSDSPELYGDEIERAFPWGNGANLASLAGRRVRLRLAMKDADLFSLRFT